MPVNRHFARLREGALLRPRKRSVRLMFEGSFHFPPIINLCRRDWEPQQVSETGEWHVALPFFYDYVFFSFEFPSPVLWHTTSGY